MKQTKTNKRHLYRLNLHHAEPPVTHAEINIKGDTTCRCLHHVEPLVPHVEIYMKERHDLPSVVYITSGIFEKGMSH